MSDNHEVFRKGRRKETVQEIICFFVLLSTQNQTNE